ncbi:MAG: hypothetical protein ABH887_01825 [bacterium]
MILIPHILTGAVISKKTNKLWLAFIFGWLSHYILDAIPHWEYLQNMIEIIMPINMVKIVIDLGLGLLIVWMLTRSFSKRKKLLVFTGAIAAILPDMVQSAVFFFKLNFLNPISVFHSTVHSNIELSFWWHLPVLILICVTSCVIIRKI